MSDSIQYLKNGQLAYVNYGGGEKTIVALHGHFGRGRYFAPFAENLGDDWRVIALEQRGHGWSAATDDYSREGYLADIKLLLDELELKQVVMMGFSLGGANAYQFAARYPERVQALVIEDIGAVCDDDLSFGLKFPPRFRSVRAARDFLTSLGFGDGMYFLESLVEHADGWSFRFDAAGMVRSQQALNGEWWSDWVASTCPALLLRGGESPVLSSDLANEMVARRPNTKLVTFPECGHGILNADLDGYVQAVTQFLADL